jgi:hypothetical protein
MNELVSEYNSSRHAAINKAPDQFTETDEIKYIANKLNEDDAKNILDLKPGDHVKVLNEQLFKKRRNYSEEVYQLNSKDGNQYIVEAEDKSVMAYPRHKLKLVSGGIIGKSLNESKRGLIDKITDYNPKTDKYKIQYEGGSTDTLAPKRFREGHPTRLSHVEVEYWNQLGGKNKLPDQFKLLNPR